MALLPCIGFPIVISLVLAGGVKFGLAGGILVAAISLPVNLLLSVPVVGLGEAAAETNPWLLLLFAAILLSGYLVVLRLKKELRS